MPSISFLFTSFFRIFFSFSFFCLDEKKKRSIVSTRIVLYVSTSTALVSGDKMQDGWLVGGSPFLFLVTVHEGFPLTGHWTVIPPMTWLNRIESNESNYHSFRLDRVTLPPGDENLFSLPSLSNFLHSSLTSNTFWRMKSASVCFLLMLSLLPSRTLKNQLNIAKV